MYSALGLASHRALHTSAFDLSVFDYALWTSASAGPLAYVPMFRHSLFAQHFMPTLLLFAPLARVFDGPAYLIVLQVFFHAAAALLLFRFASRHTTRGVALALTAAFLFSRRSYGAVTSVFYIESLEPLLIFGAVLAWSSRRLVIYWVLVVLALGCKEDVALYVAVFGIVIAATRRDRALGLATTALSIAWLAAAVGVAIPYWRGLYGLDASNPFIEGRYEGSVVSIVARVLSARSLGRAITVLSATGFLALAAPAWLAILVPGVLLNLAAAPETLQAALLGHYLWPILPWLFVAAVFGASRISADATDEEGERRLRRKRVNNGETEHRSELRYSSVSPFLRFLTVPSVSSVGWLPIAIVLIALVDTPLPRALARAPWQQPADARAALEQLAAVPADASVLAQPNLIPHLPRRMAIHGLGVYAAGQPMTDYILMTRTGDLWPFTEAEIATRARELASDAALEQVSAGPVEVFRRK